MKARRGAAWGGAVMAAALLLATPESLAGQLAEAISAHGEGVVRMTYATRPGVRVCTNGTHWTVDASPARSPRARWQGRCREGTVEVEATLRDGTVHALEVVRPDETGPEAMRDLGRVPVEQVVAFLLSLARNGAPDLAEDAIHAVVLADSVEVWPTLLDMARDQERPSRVRKSALFWLGQEAAAAVTADLVAVAEDERDDQDIRDAAVFALSQRRDSESVPALMELATSAPTPETRKAALFWLAQSEDARVPDFFARILRAPGDR